MSVFTYESTVGLLLFLIQLAIKIFAFVSSLMFSQEAYVAAGKATKPAWSLGLGIGMVLQLVGLPILFINIAFTIAALVFLVDVRPALTSLRQR